MTGEFTGLVAEKPQEVAARLREQVQIPPCAGKEVVEKRWAEPPQFNRIESQIRTNMCAAHAGTTAVEVVSFQASGQLTQRSRNFLYAKAQTYCGLYGDQGVTLGSIIKALRQDGCPPEDMYPFKGYFDSRIPTGCADAASKCKVTATLDLSLGYRAVRTLIGQNMGAAVMATDWPIEYVKGYIVEHYRPLGGFGHARCWMALAEELDAQGRPYVWCANSHDVMAQYHGYELWSPTAIDEHLARDPWGSTGITSLSVIEPQEVDWTVLNPFEK